MAEQVQLFTRAGELVATVAIPEPAEIVVWKTRYYALQAGRYVECSVINAYDPKNFTVTSASASNGFVQFHVR